jgi:hypothetical protein
MISIYLNGRLGNQLFQYTFCRISALKNKCNFFIPSNKIESIEFYSQCNNKLSSNLSMSEETNPHYWVGDKLFDVDYGINDGNIISSVVEIDIKNVNDGMLLVGFYQSDSYMVEYRDTIINDWFKFNDSVILESKGLLKQYNIDEYCYIHFRGTDYKTIPQFFLPTDYYVNAMNHIKNHKPDIKFLVITDDIDEGKKMFPDIEVISNTTEIDFYILSQSKFSIIPNSTFSWWGSWLNNNNPIVIAPNQWFNYNGGDGFFPQGIKCNMFTYV